MAGHGTVDASMAGSRSLSGVAGTVPAHPDKPRLRPPAHD